MIESFAIVIIVGLLLGALAKKLNLPNLVGMLCAGIIVGPYVLDLLDPVLLNNSGELREISLIIILINAGLSIDLNILKKLGRPAVLMSFLPAVFEMSGTIIISVFLFNLSLIDSAILASILASASPAVNVPRMIKLIKEGYGVDKGIPQLILAGDSIDDILNVVIFTTLITIRTGGLFSTGKIIQIPLSILLGILVGIILGYLLVTLFKKIHMRDSTKVLILLGVAFSLVSIEKRVRDIFVYSGLLSVVVCGIVIYKLYPIVSDRLSNKFSKLWVGAQVVLFVLVGASVNITYIGKNAVVVILMLLVLMIIRGIGILISVSGTNLSMKERLFCTLGGIPKATVQAALGGIPLSLGIESGGFMLSVSVIAILFTAPLGAYLIDNSYKKLLIKSE